MIIFFCIASNIFLSRSLFTLFGIDKIIKRYRTKPFYNNHATYAARTSNHFLSFFYNITFKYVPFFPLASTEEQKKRRFNHADEDKDGYLSQDEIISMFHPEEMPHMFDVVIDVRFSSLAFNLLINSVFLFYFLLTLSYSKKNHCNDRASSRVELH